MHRTALWTLTLLACQTADEPTHHDPTCPGATTKVSADLQAAISGAQAGDVLHVAPGEYGAVTLDRAVKLLGTRADGTCAGPYGEGGPTLTALTITAEGALAQGLQVQGAVLVEAAATLRDLTARGAERCFDLRQTTGAERIAAVECGTGIVAGGQSELWHTIVARSTGDGVRLVGAAGVSHLTTFDNQGHGLVNEHEGARLYNVLSVGNGGWGYYEQVSALDRVAFAFQGNGAGMFGHATIPPRHRPVEVANNGRNYFLLLPHDRTFFAMPLENEGIRRADVLVDRLIPPPGADLSTPAGVRAAATPTELPMRAEPMSSTLGLPAGEVRLDPRVGAIDTGAVSGWVTEVLWVSTAGDDHAAGTEQAPLRTIQAAVDKASPFQEIRVLPGTYAESVFVRNTTLVIRGFAPDGAGYAPLTDPRDPRLPVIDPRGTGRPEQGIFLADVGVQTRVEGLAFVGAMTNVTVIGLATEPPASPKLRWLRIADGRKGIDSDQSEADLTDSLVTGNVIGAVFRAVSTWKVSDTAFEDNDISIALEYTLAGPNRDFEIRDNTFRGGPVILDVVTAWRGNGYQIEGNQFDDASIVMHAAIKRPLVQLTQNTFRGDQARLVFDGDSAFMPIVQATDNTASASPPAVMSGEGWAGVEPKLTDWRFDPPLPTPPVTGFEPADREVGPHSSPIARSPDGAEIWAVAADFGGVSVFDAANQGATLGFVPTGADPRGLAITPDGKLVLVANLGAGTVSVIDRATRAVQAELEVGVEPFGVVIAPDGKKAYVSVGADPAIVRIDLASRRVDKRFTDLPIKPRGIAIWGKGAGAKLFVTHFTPIDVPEAARASLESHRAVLTVLDLPGLSGARQLTLPPVASDRFPAAVPVLMQAVVPRGDRLYLPSFGANTDRPVGQVKRDRTLLGFETTSQGLLTVVSASDEVVLTDESANLSTPGNPISGPYHIAFTPDDDTAFITSYGNDITTRFYVRDGRPPVPVMQDHFAVDLMTGSNPRGAVYDPTHKQVYAVNFASGDLSVIDVTGGTEVNRVPIAPREHDKLSREGREGKILFYAANRVAITANFWMTCGTCHPDGRTDGVTWAFDPGPRSTPPLASSVWTLPLHVDADRDEIDDFEHTIRDLQGGFALAEGDPYPAIGGKRLDSRRTPWKAVVTYMSEGIDSPRGLPESEASERGREQFRELGCTTCHAGKYFTTSRLPDNPRISGLQMLNTLRDVGTKRDYDLLREAPGFDPPSLWGVHQTAPYLHDSSAGTLLAAISDPRHLLAGAPEGRTPPSKAQLDDLIAFLSTIDSATPAVDDPHEPNNDTGSAAPLSKGVSRALVADGADWWVLETTEPSPLEVRWRDVGDSVTVRLHPADGQPTELTGPTTVQPGTWRLEIVGFGQSYDLHWGAPTH